VRGGRGIRIPRMQGGCAWGKLARGQWITYGFWATAGQDDIVHGPRPVGGLGGGSDGHGPRRTTAQRELGRGLDGGQGLAGRCSSGKVRVVDAGVQGETACEGQGAGKDNGEQK
jgi:hypothetical protein